MSVQGVDFRYSVATVLRPPADHAQKLAGQLNAPTSRETHHSLKDPYFRKGMHVLPAGASSAASPAR